MINFSKNVALLGAAMTLMGVEEPWEASLPLAQPNVRDRVREFKRRIAA